MRSAECKLPSFMEDLPSQRPLLARGELESRGSAREAAARGAAASVAPASASARPKLSVMSPVYRAEALVPALLERIGKALEPLGIEYEIVLVEDGSPDQSWRAIAEACARDPRVRGIKLSRNFGQHYAISAGLDASRGEWVVVMDCDLQDAPEEIPRLLARAEEGYHVVLAQRSQRRDGVVKRFFSRQFYRLLSSLSGTEYDSSVANFGIYHRRVVDTIVGMRESIRFFPAMVRWVGFRRATLPVTHGQREIGESSYDFARLLRLALDVILAYSDKPLRLTIRLGFSVSLVGLVYALYNLIDFLRGGIIVPGYASLIISLWVLSGLIIMVLGVVGLYVGKTFEGVKSRPIYVVEEDVGGAR